MKFAAGSLPNFYTYPSTRYGFTLDMSIHVAVSKDAVSKEAAKKAKNAFMESTSVTPRFSVLFKATHTASAGNGITNGIFVRSYPLNGTIEISMVDTVGRTAVLMTDPICSAHLATAGTHYVAVVADAGPNMLSFMVDGRLCDGGPDIKTWPNVREGRMNE